MGRNVFTLPSNKEIYVKNMADIVLVNEVKIDTSKNVFLDRDYFEEIDRNKDIHNCSGRYKKVWERQEGICYICSKQIKLEQPKTIIYKRKSSKDKTIRNLAYVHDYCKDSVAEYVDVNNGDIVTLTFQQIEKILGFKMCPIAYKYKSYFYVKKEGMISESWISQGFKINNVNMEEQKIDFIKVDFRRTKIIIPKFLYRIDLPQEAIDETKNFFTFTGKI